MELQECIRKRRDTRHFLPDSIPREVLDLAFQSAHQAPSVGLSEPWRFVVVSSLEKRRILYENFLKTRSDAEKEIVDARRKEKFASLKLEALRDAPKVIGLFCERPPESRFTIGVQGSRDTLLWSCACAIQNFWLSLTEQGYSAGWISILDYQLLNRTLEVPETWEPLGLLCVGKPATDYGGVPMLQKEGWEKRSNNPTVIEV